MFSNEQACPLGAAVIRQAAMGCEKGSLFAWPTFNPGNPTKTRQASEIAAHSAPLDAHEPTADVSSRPSEVDRPE
jgi:hypothetical protein